MNGDLIFKFIGSRSRNGMEHEKNERDWESISRRQEERERKKNLKNFRDAKFKQLNDLAVEVAE